MVKNTIFLQPGNRARLFLVAHGDNLERGIESRPSRLDQIASFIYHNARRRPKSERWILRTGRVSQAKVARAMGVHPSTLGRVLAGQTSPYTEDFTNGLMQLGGYESRLDLEAQLEDFRPVPHGAFRKYPKKNTK
jgi:hypothetical protein